MGEQEDLKSEHQTPKPESSGSKGHKSSPCPERWIHQGQASYLFSDENFSWQRCSSFCSSQESRFLKIDGKEELDFIKKASYQYVEDRQGLPYYFPFWIGLSYDPSTKKWGWMDGTALSSGLFHVPGGPSDNFQSGACAYFQGGNAKAGNCEETRFCICEKTRVATDQLG
ncbi:oxidized low-density lipoprotein receptor 1-like [Mauremys mutica]|uniref:oxidized low-density lipoprotein receptor 1-like n=1 Tax=Mauremys mutica TaxID=74926 RepID=UPI001D161D8A|nr:oxidized low-density lipoprotein receptor 1-like [Mauremys mutica]